MTEINNIGKETDRLIDFIEKGPAPEGYALAVLKDTADRTKRIAPGHPDAPHFARLWKSALVQVGKATPGMALSDAQSAFGNPVLKQKGLEYISEFALTLPVTDDFKERALQLAAKSADKGSPLEAKLAGDWASLLAGKEGTTHFASDPKFLAAAAWTNSEEGSALRQQAGALTPNKVVRRLEGIGRRPYFELVPRSAPG